VINTVTRALAYPPFGTVATMIVRLVVGIQNRCYGASRWSGRA
jgi:hypothetical protein